VNSLSQLGITITWDGGITRKSSAEYSLTKKAVLMKKQQILNGHGTSDEEKI
jgi:hypothetical protein